MSIVLQSSGGGQITLAEPTTASNFTQTLPAATGTAILANTSGDLQINSGFGSNATAYGCRAWITFTVSGGTSSIAGSGNISSITDNGAGDFTFNFSTNMPNTNYCAVGVGTGGGANYQIFGGNQSFGFVKSVGSLRAQFGFVSSVGGALSNQDPVSAEIAFFR